MILVMWWRWLWRVSTKGVQSVTLLTKLVAKCGHVLLEPEQLLLLKRKRAVKRLHGVLQKRHLRLKLCYL